MRNFIRHMSAQWTSPKRLNESLNRFGRYVTPSGAAAGAILLIATIALFVPPYVGMADNGDFFRILYSNGLYFNVPDYNSQYLGYFVKDYGIFQYYNENGATLSSSQSLFIRLSLIVAEAFGYHDHFDIRFQAAILMLLYAAAVYLLVESMTWRTPRKQGWIIAAVAVFVFGDIGYIAYFNSFYSESIVLIMLLFVFASGLLLYRKRYNDYVMMAVFGLSGLLLTTSKQQNAPLGVLIALVGIFLVYIRGGRTYRSLMGLTLAGLLLAGVGTYVLIPETFVNINKYHAMTRGVLLESDNPEDALKSFGIDKQYAALRGTIYYDPYTPLDVNSEQMEREFYGKFGFGSIVRYYVTHPDQAAKMAQVAAENAFMNRPPALGNYEKAAGKPFGAKAWFFSGYSLLKQTLVPKTTGFLVLWFGTIVGLYMPSFVADLRKRRRRRAVRMPLVTMMMLIGFSGMAVSIVGAGDADLAKHQFTFAASFDLVCFVAFSDLLCRRLWGNRAELEEEEPTSEEVAVFYKSARV